MSFEITGVSKCFEFCQNYESGTERCINPGTGSEALF